MFGKYQCFQQMCATPHNHRRTLEGLEVRFGGGNTRERARERESERARERMRGASQTSSSRDKVQMGSTLLGQKHEMRGFDEAEEGPSVQCEADEDSEGRGRRERRPERIFSLSVPINAARWEDTSLTKYDAPGTPRLHAMVRERD